MHSLIFILLVLALVSLGCHTTPPRHASPTTLRSNDFTWTRLTDYPGGHGVAGAFAGLHNGVLIVAGGCNFPDAKPWEGGRKHFTADILALAPGSSEWSPCGQLPRPTAYGVCVSTPYGVFCAGGSDAAVAFSEAFLLEWNGQRLTRTDLPPLPTPLANACAATIGSVVYVATGTASPDLLNTELLTTLISLDLAHPERGWRELPALPGPGRFLAVAGSDGHALHVFSGIARQVSPDHPPALEYLSDAYQFTPDTVGGGTWTRLADLPRPNAASPSPAPLVAGAGLLLVGEGANGRTNHLPAPERPAIGASALLFNLRTKTWQHWGDIPCARVTTPTAQQGDSFIIISGESRPGVRSPEVWTATPR